MKILFVFTGGTIGSTLTRDNVIATDSEKAYKIIKAYAKQYKLDFDYDIVEPYTELSENSIWDITELLLLMEQIHFNIPLRLLDIRSDVILFRYAWYRLIDLSNILKVTRYAICTERYALLKAAREEVFLCLTVTIIATPCVFIDQQDL